MRLFWNRRSFWKHSIPPQTDAMKRHAEYLWACAGERWTNKGKSSRPDQNRQYVHSGLSLSRGLAKKGPPPYQKQVSGPVKKALKNPPPPHFSFLNTQNFENPQLSNKKEIGTF